MERLIPMQLSPPFQSHTYPRALDRAVTACSNRSDAFGSKCACKKKTISNRGELLKIKCAQQQWLVWCVNKKLVVSEIQWETTTGI